MTLPRVVSALVLVALSGALTPAVHGAADLILLNGRVHTLDAKTPDATAVAVESGFISYVGDNDGAAAHLGPGTRVVDLTGLTVVPGLNDAHMHLAGVGFRELTFDLEGTAGIDDLRTKLHTRVASTPPGRWVTGRGWIETHWSPPVFPTAADIDEVSPSHPVALTRADGHALVANSLALRLARIDTSTPNPPGGEILRDPSTGEATGVLVDAAMAFVRRLIPAATPAETEEALVVGAAREAALGWTGIQIAGHDFEEAEMVRRLVAEKRIRLRVHDAVSAPGEDARRLFNGGVVIGESGGRYTRRGVKFYMDGALGSRGAALLEPYADYASSGLIVQDLDAYGAFLAEALRAGVQVQTHAIGDRGNRMVLDHYEAALAAVPVGERAVADPRWRVEHAQILHEEDIPRFAKLGVIASMQPSHAIGDLFFAPSRLGPDRLRGAYAWQSLLASGAVIAAGSDAPVERGEPMIEFYAAVARRSLDGFSGDGWHPEQTMTREQALRTMTVGAAHSVHEEEIRGTISVGMLADFTVLSADIMAIPEEEILKTRCVITIVGGEIVHDSRNLSEP